MHYRGRNLTRRSPRSAPIRPNPFDPSSPGFAERSATHVTDLGNGMVRVDVGAPPARLPSETQPIREHKREAVHRAAPARSPAPAPAPAKAPSEAGADRQRNHRAITREP
jgi:hypothetical protein